MAAHALVVALLAVSPTAPPAEPAANEKTTNVTVVSEPRTPHELRTAVHEAMRRQATTSGTEKAAATRELISLYKEVSDSTVLTDADKRRQAAYLRSRLRRTSTALARQLAVDDQPAAERPQAAAAPGQPAAQALLAQKPGNAARPAAGAQAPPANFLAPQATVGQPGGGGSSWDAMTAQNAQELIELIQNTIAPHTWDVNGGHGVIRYFAPGQVLVIRQSGGVHGQVGDAIQNLRK